jgi:hypothetical protein
MGWLRRALLIPVSELAWRIPGRPSRLLAEFSLAERGSMVDMLAAADATERREMRKKYFLHALDEWRHSGIFAERVRALTPEGTRTRAAAAIEDASVLQAHGFVGGKSLFERLGEFDFLAFVYVAEADAVEQFHVYIERELPDATTVTALKDILKDEAFHVSYSRAECDRYRKAGRPIDAAIRDTRLRRIGEGWLRFSKDFGDRMSALWLGLLYFVALAPFRPFARLEKGGWLVRDVSAVSTPESRLAAAHREG